MHQTMVTLHEVKTLEGVLSALIGTRKFGSKVQKKAEHEQQSQEEILREVDTKY